MFDKNGSFPFYNGKPYKLSLGQWIFWLVATIGGFFVFTGIGFPESFNKFVETLSKLEKNMVGIAIMVSVFVLVFGSYYIISKKNLGLLFPPITKKQLGSSMVIGWAGLIVIGLFTNFVVEDVFHVITHKDSAFTTIGLGTFIETTIQLFLEEMWAIVPFLAILAIGTKFKVDRKISIILAWVLSSIIFALYHIESYDGDIVQVLLVITPARLILTYSYLRYKSIWASYTTHLTYDLTILGISVLGKFLSSL